MAELHFFTGTMDSGKSTLALQTNHNHAARGRIGRIFTTHDRAGEATISSRLGLEHEALEVAADFDFWRYVVDSLTHGARIDYLICDEAQFYAPRQIDQLARIVDELQIDVFAFGILSDFRTELFDGSRRLVELADRTHVLQVEALCWCGKRATHNARTENGEMVTEGEVIVVGDVETTEAEAAPPGDVAYEVLCRQHHRRRMTSARARAITMISEPSPSSSRVEGLARRVEGSGSSSRGFWLVEIACTVPRTSDRSRTARPTPECLRTPLTKARVGTLKIARPDGGWFTKIVRLRCR